MTQEERLKAKYFSIGRNVGRKETREDQQTERNRVHKAGIKKGRKIERNLARKERRNKWDWKSERRKKWDWKYRVFSVRTVVTIASSVVAVKAVDLAMMYFGR
jgi:hypothetical protein